jgi:hypothetical protein
MECRERRETSNTERGEERRQTKQRTRYAYSEGLGGWPREGNPDKQLERERERVCL